MQNGHGVRLAGFPERRVCTWCLAARHFSPRCCERLHVSSCLRELVESRQVSNEQVSSLVLARTRSFYTYPSEATVTIPVPTVPLPRTQRTRFEHEVSRSSRQSIRGRAQGRGPPP